MVLYVSGVICCKKDINSVSRYPIKAQRLIMALQLNSGVSVNFEWLESSSLSGLCVSSHDRLGLYL